jgi:hypothetical protein
MDGYNFTVNGVTYPINENASLDPKLGNLLDYFSVLLQAYLGDKWKKICTNVGLDSLKDSIVAKKHLSPLDVGLTGSLTSFPVLSLCRTGSDKTKGCPVQKPMFDASLELGFMFPPLDVGQIAKVYPLLHNIETVIRKSIIWGYDSRYLGESFSIVKLESFDCKHMMMEVETSERSKQKTMPGLILNLVMTESYESNDQYPDLEQLFLSITKDDVEVSEVEINFNV